MGGHRGKDEISAQAAVALVAARVASTTQSTPRMASSTNMPTIVKTPAPAPAPASTVEAILNNSNQIAELTLEFKILIALSVKALHLAMS